jgi:hypothetical protein
MIAARIGMPLDLVSKVLTWPGDKWFEKEADGWHITPKARQEVPLLSA